jgi:hypothetical protein
MDTAIDQTPDARSQVLCLQKRQKRYADVAILSCRPARHRCRENRADLEETDAIGLIVLLFALLLGISPGLRALFKIGSQGSLSALPARH